MSHLRLITFDVTGTLLNFRKPVMEQYANIAAKHGITAHPQDLQRNFKTTWKELEARHPNFGCTTGLGWQKWWQNIVVGTFRGQNIELNRLTTLGDALIEHFNTANAYSVVPGCHFLLQTLRSRNLQLGIISNSDERLRTILSNVQLYDQFNFVLTSYDAKCMKPDRKIFSKALELSGLKNPRQALHVGNDEELDVKGAKGAGFAAVLVGKSILLKFPEVADDLNGVLKCIDSIH